MPELCPSLRRLIPEGLLSDIVMRRLPANIITLLFVAVASWHLARSQNASSGTPLPDKAAVSGFSQVAEINTRRDIARAFDEMIDVGGYALHITCSGRQKKQAPAVVLEAGLNQGSETWNKVQPEVARFACVCGYDRAGIGRSDPLPRPQFRTSQQIVQDLHVLLERARVAPPYVLVGHSFGGASVRLYASRYPKEVVGMVLVDSVHEEETVKWLAMVPPEIRAQMEAAGARQPLGGEAIDLGTSMRQVKAANWHTTIPLVVLARGPAFFSPDDYPPPLRSLAPRGEELRIEMQRDLAARSTNGKLIFAEKSGHFIQQDEPALVIEAIRGIVESKRSKPDQR